MYRADQHTHSVCSPDGFAQMTQMTRAALDAGLSEICLTDHFDLIDHEGNRPRSFDWAAEREQVLRAREESGGKIRISLGVELGEAPEDFEAAGRVLAQEPELDFVIGSLHNMGTVYGGGDYYFTDYRHNPELCRAHLDCYFPLMLELCEKGEFDSLGHILYPLRYMKRRDGNEIDLKDYEAQLRQVFRLLRETGRALELNTTRTRDLSDQREVFSLYRACGGELVTVGSDAHRPEHVGIGLDEAYELLRELGFRHVTRYERRKPVRERL